MMTVVVNGTAREIHKGATVADLLAQLELKTQFVAVERNREVVPKPRHAEVVLEDGDQIEVVTLVGGG